MIPSPDGTRRGIGHALAIPLALATVVTLELIVLMGAGVPNSAAGNQLTAVLVPIMDLCLVTSSALLAWIFGQNGAGLLQGCSCSTWPCSPPPR